VIGITEIIGSIGAGAGITLASGGAAADAGITIAVEGAIAGTALVTVSGTIAARSAASLDADMDKFFEARMNAERGAEGAGSKLPTNDSQLKHIFRNDVGHIPDTLENRQLLERVTNIQKNYLGTDKYGVDWYGQIQPDGSQIWVRSYKGTISDGGVNSIPRSFDPQTGLNNNPFTK
jgi:hypothetical protein